MSTAFERGQTSLLTNPARWLVTGGAGFIGSHLIENLLMLNQEVTCLDDFSAGSLENLQAIREAVGEKKASRLRIVTGDLAEPEICADAVEGARCILHHGALGSVPLSIENPSLAHRSNVTGTFALFNAAREAGIRRVVYASSSAVYGDEPGLPKTEEMKGNLLSPYAATKAIAENYATAFSQSFDMEFVGLRYFNVFGPRQDPGGAYAAVIPAWVRSMLREEAIYINGDGETTRDFIYIDDVVQANLLAATASSLTEGNRIFNVALGKSTSLNTLFSEIRTALSRIRPDIVIPDPTYRDFRAGDVRHSFADFSRVREELGFEPSCDLASGLNRGMRWFADNLGADVPA